MTDDDLRDSFGDELTDALQCAGGADPVGDRGRHRRETRPPMRARAYFTATLAAAVAASAVLVFSLRTHGTAHVNVAAEPSSTSTGPAAAVGPTGVVDWTWVSPDRGWALRARPAARPFASRCGDDRRRSNMDDRADPPSAVSVRADRRRDLLCGPALRLRRSVRFRSLSVIVWPGLAADDRRRQHVGPVPGPDVTDIETSNGVALRLSTTNWPGCADSCAYRVERQQLVSAPWQPVGRPISGRPSLIIPPRPRRRRERSGYRSARSVGVAPFDRRRHHLDRYGRSLRGGRLRARHDLGERGAGRRVRGALLGPAAADLTVRPDLRRRRQDVRAVPSGADRHVRRAASGVAGDVDRRLQWRACELGPRFDRWRRHLAYDAGHAPAHRRLPAARLGDLPDCESHVRHRQHLDHAGDGGAHWTENAVAS